MKENKMEDKTIIVVDIEATCWETEEERPQGTNSEIIEIGVAILHPDGTIDYQEEDMLVKPQMSSVSDFCTKLTSITQSMVNRHPGFGTVLGQFETRFDTKNRTWASWGDYDRTMFQNCCKTFGAQYPFPDSHINVKTEFAEKMGLEKGVGMPRALKMAKISLDGTHHRGKDDAYNIAKLLRFIRE